MLAHCNSDLLEKKEQELIYLSYPLKAWHDHFYIPEPESFFVFHPVFKMADLSWRKVSTTPTRRLVDYSDIAPSRPAQSRYTGIGKVPPSGYGGPRAPTTRLGDQMRQQRREDFQVGTIIRAPLHEQDSANTYPGDPCLTESIHGKIFTKKRKMIVVALYHYHYLAVPLYSHSGSGLERKPNKDEYVSVRDHRSDQPFQPQSRHTPLLTGVLRKEVDRYYPTSVAHVTFPQSRDYRAECIIEGRLDSTSTQRLRDLYWSFSPYYR